MLKIAIILCIIFVVSSVNSYDGARFRAYVNESNTKIDKWIAGIDNEYTQFSEEFTRIKQTLHDLADKNCNKVDDECSKYYDQGNSDIKEIVSKASSLNVTTTDCENILTSMRSEYEKTKSEMSRCYEEAALKINNGTSSINVPNPRDKLDVLRQKALECAKKDDIEQAFYCIVYADTTTLVDTSKIKMKIIDATKKLRDFETSYKRFVPSNNPLESFKTKTRSIVNEYKKCVEGLISKADELKNNSENNPEISSTNENTEMHQ